MVCFFHLSWPRPVGQRQRKLNSTVDGGGAEKDVTLSIFKNPLETASTTPLKFVKNTDSLTTALATNINLFLFLQKTHPVGHKGFSVENIGPLQFQRELRPRVPFCSFLCGYNKNKNVTSRLKFSQIYQHFFRDSIEFNNSYCFNIQAVNKEHFVRKFLTQTT